MRIGFMRARHVVTCQSSHADGVVLVFNTHALSQASVPEVCYIARCKDTRGRGSQVFIDHDPVSHLQPRLLRKSNVRADSNSGHDPIRPDKTPTSSLDCEAVAGLLCGGPRKLDAFWGLFRGYLPLAE